MTGTGRPAALTAAQVLVALIRLRQDRVAGHAAG
jgi:hypothetical protein